MFIQSEIFGILEPILPSIFQSNLNHQTIIIFVLVVFGPLVTLFRSLPVFLVNILTSSAGSYLLFLIQSIVIHTLQIISMFTTSIVSSCLILTVQILSIFFVSGLILNFLLIDYLLQYFTMI
jgi:hypothetical protein